jgi:hypothetical protein
MRRVSLRELQLNTSGIVMERRGVPVAELRPIEGYPQANKLPDCEAQIRLLPKVTIDSGRILEQDRT